MPNNSTVLSVASPSTVVAGSSFSASITMQNTGTTTWSESGNYHLGSCSASGTGDDQTWGPARWYILPLGTGVPPGGTFSFDVSGLVAPLSPGAYPLRLRMVQDAVEWFGAQNSLTISVSAAPPPPPPPPVPLSTLLPSPSSNGYGNLFYREIFNTGAYSAAVYNPTNIATKKVVNDTGYIIEIRHIYGWYGVDRHGIGDVGFVVHKENGCLFYNNSWDHYDEPTNLHKDRVSYGPGEILILPNEVLVMRYWFDDFERITPTNPPPPQGAGKPAKHAHQSLEICGRYVVPTPMLPTRPAGPSIIS